MLYNFDILTTKLKGTKVLSASYFNSYLFFIRVNHSII